jgi:hypothetical protein
MAACQPTLVVPPGFEPLVAPLPALAVPPGFVPHAASTMPAAPHVAQESQAVCNTRFLQQQIFVELVVH